MSTTIRLDVDVNKGKAIADLSTIESELAKLNKTATAIRLDIQGADKVKDGLSKVRTEANNTAAAIAKLNKISGPDTLANLQAKLDSVTVSMGKLETVTLDMSSNLSTLRNALKTLGSKDASLEQKIAAYEQFGKVLSTLKTQISTQNTKTIISDKESAAAEKLANSVALLEAKLQSVTMKMASLRSNTLSMGDHLKSLNADLAVLENPSSTLEQKQTAYERFNNTLRLLRQEISNVAQAERNEDAAARGAGEAEEKHAKGLQNTGSAAQGASKALSAFSVFLGNIASRAFHLVLAKITQALREAINTMKGVDTQLINISKVSGITGTALADIGERAYDTAKKYGVAADTYLEAVYTFQKAGLGQSAEDMGELAVKTMLVGDTTADVATQFLISANAAWKLGGNMERLGQIVDEADYINNNYATDLGKLSSGLPRVASVAAQAGMSAEETLAALGTITAVTQESGTKAATALRALILNIEGQVGTFVDDTGEEFKVTEESVKSMQGLMEKYAKAELEAAKASGELINPLTAIRAIFKGMANSDLNDQELFTLLSGMGGKLRTNQLTALVQNYQLLDEMLERIAGSAGTADSEISLMMDSWEKKSQNLKTAWAQLVNDTLNSDTIKNRIDDLRRVIEDIDTEFFHHDASLKETNEEISALEKEYETLLAKGSALTDWEEQRIKYLQLRIDLLKEEAAIEAKLLANSWLRNNSRNEDHHVPQYETNYNSLVSQYETLGAQLGAGELNFAEYSAGMKALVSQFDDYYDGLVKARDAGAELNETELDFIRDFEGVTNVATSQIGAVREYNDEYKLLVDTQGNVIALLRNKETVEAEIAAAEEATADAAARREFEATLAAEGLITTLAQSEDAAAGLDIIGASAEAVAQVLHDVYEAATSASFCFGGLSVPNATTNGAEELAAALAQAKKEAEDTKAVLESMQNPEGAWNGSGTWEEYTAAKKAAEDAAAEYERLASQANDADIATEGVAEAADGISFDSAVSGASSLVDLLRQAAIWALGIVVPTFPGFASGTTNAPGGPTLVNELGPELISENGRAYIANGGRPGIVNLSRGAIVLPAGVTKEALRGGNKGRTINAAGEGTSNLPLGATQAGYTGPTQITTGSDYSNATQIWICPKCGTHNPIGSYKCRKCGFGESSKYWVCKKCKAHNPESSKVCLSCGTPKGKGGSGGGGSGGGGKSSGLSKKQAQKLAEDLKDLLSNLDKQATLANNQGDYAREAQIYEQAQEAIKKMVDDYRRAGYSDDSDEILDLLNKNYDYANKQLSLYQSKWDELIEALEADTDAQEMANKLAEKQQAVDDAREALANAQRQRTVRMYNAATGQWEWVSDNKTVSKAQESLTKAEDAYAEELKSQAITELKNAKEAGLALEDIVLGPALSAVALMAEETDEFQNFARALNAVYGVGSFLQSTEGSSKVIPTTDSHDINYTFGNVTLTEEEASSMSVAELAKKLSVLNIS